VSPGTPDRMGDELTREQAGQSSISLAAKLLAPYLSVLVFWIGFRNAWLAILSYHAQIVFWLWYDKNLPRWKPVPIRELLLSLPSALAGPAVYFILPLVSTTPIAAWLATHRLSDTSLIAIVLYFGLVHPPLEQMHWAPLRIRTAWSHVAFAAYHVIVLASLLPPLWLAVSLAVLLGASWIWQWLDERGSGLLVPVVSHVLADTGIAFAALLLVGASV
jgi:hypothetical protein